MNISEVLGASLTGAASKLHMRNYLEKQEPVTQDRTLTGQVGKKVSDLVGARKPLGVMGHTTPWPRWWGKAERERE
jgi:hypothetical protein